VSCESFHHSYKRAGLLARGGKELHDRDEWAEREDVDEQ
jgi:hypothetical protein